MSSGLPKSQTAEPTDTGGPDTLVVNLQIVSPSVGVNRPLLFPDLPAATTIKQLKDKIRNALPVRPPDENQRLIHRGRALLRETDSLLDIFGADSVSWRFFLCQYYPSELSMRLTMIFPQNSFRHQIAKPSISSSGTLSTAIRPVPHLPRDVIRVPWSGRVKQLQRRQQSLPLLTYKLDHSRLRYLRDEHTLNLPRPQDLTPECRLQLRPRQRFPQIPPLPFSNSIRT